MLEMTRARTTWTRLTIVVLLLVGSAGVAAPALAAQPSRWDAAAVGATGLQLCVDRARTSGSDAWVCTPAGLTSTDRTRSGQPRTTFEPIRAASALTAQAVEPDPDTWCEHGTVCTNRYSASIAWVKGNLAYGDQNGVIGSWDNVLRVNMNGRSPRYTLYAIHDSGPTVYLNLSLTCNEVPWPYSQCGYSARHPVISASSRKYNSGLIHGAPLSDATTYRATVGGDFQAAGHSQDFIIGALRSLTWKCPSSGNCTFP